MLARIAALVLGAVLLAATLTGCINAALPSSDEMASVAGRLQGVFPTLEKLQVDTWRDQDWCRMIDYPGGSFSNLLDGDDGSATCNLFEPPARPFTDQASADFDRIERAFREAGTNVWLAWWITYDEQGRVTAVEFDVAAGLADAWSYLYSRDGPVDAEAWTQAAAFRQVNDHWWFVADDWN